MYKILCGLLLVISGCANPINRYTAAKYYEWGSQAEQNGNLEAARESYRRATLNVDWGNLGTRAKAYTLYEYGRVSGYLCYHDEAEKYLKESLSLQEKDEAVRSQLRPPTLLELARFYYDTNRKNDALPYYEEGISMARGLDVKRTHPIQFAITLEEYADCLQFVGKTDEATKIGEEAKDIRNSNLGSKIESPFQRYNTRCNK